MIAREPLGEALLLRLGHGKANALDVEFARALAATLHELRNDSRPLILTGSGSIFSAGVDLKRVVAGGAAYVREFLPALSDGLLALFAHPGPVVAAVNGHALAGGAILALACDRRVQQLGPYRFGVPELRVGVPFPLVPLEILRATLPPALVARLVLTGESFAPERALELGLVDAVAESSALLEMAREEAERMGRVPARAFRLTKSGLRAHALERIARLREASDRAVEEAWSSSEVLSAVRSYVEATLL